MYIIHRPQIQKIFNDNCYVRHDQWALNMSQENHNVQV